ncbi:MAG: SH3 domain-containing protein [Fibrobacteraceae bacterium]|nr:SH3 domain-containing protein [Fibrobacteraceae bacterium]
MNSKIILLSALLIASQSFAAQVKDVAFACGKKSCDLTFRFASAENLPNYFQKFDAKSGKWTVAFAASDFAFGEDSFELDPAAVLLKDVRVFKESGRQGPLLKFEWTAGEALKSNQNPVTLKGSNFTITLPQVKAKSWKLSAVAASKKQAAEKAAKLKAAEEKKAALEAEKAAKKKAAEEKKAVLEAEKAAKKKAAEERKTALEAEKAAKKQAAEEKKAEVASSDSSVKAPAVSALIEGISEMTAVSGFGKNQFSLKMYSPISLDKISYLEKKNAVLVSMPGPTKSPVFKVNANSFVKSLTWTADGLLINLLSGIRPAMIVKDGSLLLQTKATELLNGYVYWKALPIGIQAKRWLQEKETIPTLESFVARYEKDSKKVVSAAQAFFLTSVARELIVTAEEIELYEAPSEQSTVIARLAFGDRLESVELKGLYQKVQYGPRTGYVNKRAVAFRDELSAIQTERLKQLAVEKGESLDSVNARFASLTDDDRVMYSSFGRRDPFIDVKGLVEEGINIDQVELVGIIWESDEPMAILSDVKNPSVSYTIKEGDKVLNGKVLKITQTDVLFLIQEFGVSRRYSMGLPDKFGGDK